MQLLKLLPSLVILATICYQDYKQRAVYWVLFPLLMLSLAFQLSFDTLIGNIIPNVLFLLFLLIGLSVYFSIKERKFILITEQYLGLGDVLFLASIAVFISPVNFMLFFLLSLLLVFILVLFIPKWRNSIPLAGIQAFLFFIFLLGQQFAAINLSSDNWLLAWIA